MVLDHSHLFSEVSKLDLTQSFREDICHLFPCRDVLQLYNSLLDIVSDEVALNVNVLGTIMEHRIFRDLDATLIITQNSGRFHPLLE